MSDGEYYLGSKWNIGNKDYHMYICEGARSRGKTTVWVNACMQRSYNFIKQGVQNHKFVFLRRSTVQMQLAIEKGILNSCREVYPDFYNEHPKDRYVKSSIFLSDEDGEKFTHVGYYTDLNNVKGISIEDADVLLFDEFVELDRSAYKGGDGGVREPELFARLCETLFRGREFWVILLGNHDRPTNPYVEYFRIPFGAKKWRDKERGIYYEFDVATKATRIKRETSVLGKIFANSNYNSYALGDTSALKLQPEFIAQKPAHAKMTYNLKILGKQLTLWFDEDKGIEYITDRCKFNMQYPILSVTRDDMSINTEFIAYNSQFLLMQKTLYGAGRVRFSDDKVAELFYIMLGIT